MILNHTSRFSMSLAILWMITSQDQDHVNSPYHPTHDQETLCPGNGTTLPEFERWRAEAVDRGGSEICWDHRGPLKKWCTNCDYLYTTYLRYFTLYIGLGQAQALPPIADPNTHVALHWWPGSFHSQYFGLTSCAPLGSRQQFIFWTTEYTTLESVVLAAVAGGQCLPSAPDSEHQVLPRC